MGYEESIEELKKRAIEEVNILIEKINYLLEQRLPMELKYNQISIQELNKMAYNLGVNVEIDNQIENLISGYIKLLSNLKGSLETIEINENTLIQDDLIEKTQNVLGLIEEALLEEKINILKQNYSSITEKYKQSQREEEKSKENAEEVEEKNLEGNNEVITKSDTKESDYTPEIVIDENGTLSFKEPYEGDIR